MPWDESFWAGGLNGGRHRHGAMLAQQAPALRPFRMTRIHSGCATRLAARETKLDNRTSNSTQTHDSYGWHPAS